MFECGGRSRTDAPRGENALGIGAALLVVSAPPVETCSRIQATRVLLPVLLPRPYSTALYYPDFMLPRAPMVALYTIAPTFGGMGAALTHLAHLMELSVAQNMETACRCEKAQRESHAHIARKG